MTPFRETKETDTTYTLTVLAHAQEHLRKAQDALTKGSPGAAVGSLLEAQNALTMVLIRTGQLVGRHQGKYPQ